MSDIFYFLVISQFRYAEKYGIRKTKSCKKCKIHDTNRCKLYKKQDERTCINRNKGTYKEKKYYGSRIRCIPVKPNRQNTHSPCKCHPLVWHVNPMSAMFCSKNGCIGTASDSLISFIITHRGHRDWLSVCKISA